MTKTVTLRGFQNPLTKENAQMYTKDQDYEAGVY